MGTRRSNRPSASGGLSPEVRAKISAIQREFGQLERKAQFSSVHDTIGQIEERLAEYPNELAALQRRGYAHTRPLEEKLQSLKEEWRTNKPRLQSTLRQKKSQLSGDVTSASRMVARVKRGQKSVIDSAERAIERLETKVTAADRELNSLYSNVDSELYVVERGLGQIGWMLDALESSPEIKLQGGEGPLRAVETEWHRDGDEGPEGVLYLTDQRLLFEQKEEVVTKKRFGIFKAESEMVHKLWLDINVDDIAKVEDKEEGGFLGMGKDDILEMTYSGKAPISRARFHLKGQDSADWRTLIKRIQSGDMVADLPGGAVAESRAASFPTQCPNCMANLPQPHRGATHITCDFCGATVGPNPA
jgi:hypothetical protein